MNGALFTVNTSFLNENRLEQDPFYAIDAIDGSNTRFEHCRLAGLQLDAAWIDKQTTCRTAHFLNAAFRAIHAARVVGINPTSAARSASEVSRRHAINKKGTRLQA